ncbi:MAG: PIG-L family deacetylase [Candidatus Nanopelagicales bacterium]|jgi:LmbE family N-acetylglucosaminyl deacetylase|nr:PIG-L family deacetylase [Candidatus Nanopelagicales bacterium]MCU0295166.1 PIG-L family deacetylase [Candidatus Nanopelagicales bacterium]MCU0299484.1 PIG-L family deacetylase [Candidatus Nanopelagicales bacterium]
MELLEHTPQRVLAIVAHPDDIEYGAAAAVAMWTAAGADCRYLLATRGEAGIDGMDPQTAAAVREQEQHRSAEVVGVEVVEFLDHPDGTIEYGLTLRRELAEAIRRHRPDTVLLFNHRESWGPGARNSADHQAVGTAALDAVADAGNRWIFPGTEPHHASLVLVAGSPQATHAIDVSAGVDRAVASLSEHRAYLEGLGEHPMADPEFLRAFLEQTGTRVGVPAALAVEVWRF